MPAQIIQNITNIGQERVRETWIIGFYNGKGRLSQWKWTNNLNLSIE
jgi:hypothetical protein